MFIVAGQAMMRASTSQGVVTNARMSPGIQLCVSAAVHSRGLVDRGRMGAWFIRLRCCRPTGTDLPSRCKGGREACHLRRASPPRHCRDGNAGGLKLQGRQLCKLGGNINVTEKTVRRPGLNNDEFAR